MLRRPFYNNYEKVEGWGLFIKRFFFNRTVMHGCVFGARTVNELQKKKKSKLTVSQNKN